MALVLIDKKDKNYPLYVLEVMEGLNERMEAKGWNYPKDDIKYSYEYFSVQTQSPYYSWDAMQLISRLYSRDGWEITIRKSGEDETHKTIHNYMFQAKKI